MSPLRLRYGVLTSIPLLSLVLSFAGCGTSATKDGPKAPPAAASSTTEAGRASQSPHAGPAKPGNEADSGTSEELAKLPPQDRALAEKQKTCPVTGAPLGSMGVPYKVTLKGQTVFLCCAGCEEKLRKDADKYLAKLKGTEPK